MTGVTPRELLEEAEPATAVGVRGDEREVEREMRQRSTTITTSRRIELNIRRP